MAVADTMAEVPTGKAGSPAVEVDPELKQTSYGGSSQEASDESYAAALKKMITDYKFENNRRYHAYKAGRYLYPNDEIENDRLDIMHKMTEVTLEGKMNLAPISRSPERILDIGTGTGLWAIDMGDRYPNTEILGNDLSPIQPQCIKIFKMGILSYERDSLTQAITRTPPNVHFEVDDCEADWTYSNTFDYIHCRYMGNAIRDWGRLVKQCYEFTTPNGYTEFQDLDVAITSTDNTMGPISTKMNTEWLKASRAAGFEPCPGPQLESHLITAGFKDVKAFKYALPIGPWAMDPHMKHLGNWNYLQLMQGLESLIYRLFTTTMGYSRAECDVVCAKIRQEMRDPRVHMYYNMYVAYGRKPAAATE